ncbi:NAD(P)-dependent dehydrogenase (short-subunit alcohol dehydrogenase family) [Angulomicrobium tetraedrale]|uniref:NAD(P)-dependent dehydrogenase (Short-subunit alcohol dehydrogenase family) n=1 Tax=Ancylobacter tetraedralis TaxID=217068 RepID=A0A839Z7J3_9HYPH|nr:SDR family NAD(P)-dependent oxidoreductase [Ancylobacter tetraedralis]MBB3770158.1 NAD(P)-dependent dehydrogenase (short-subunit alcohol dehydrogenase family) [Ancylobacter tetraedralis]
MYKLDGRIALVTGGAVGIGRGIATRLAQEGCDVAILDLDLAGAEETAAMVRAAGRRALVRGVDVADADAVAAAVEEIKTALGPIDIAINNAAITGVGKVVDIEPAAWRRMFAINTDSVFHVARSVLPDMIARRNGRIVNIASWFGKIGKPNYAAYSASKAAVIVFTQALAAEVAPLGINVNAVCPGSIVGTKMRDDADRLSREQGLPTAKEREHLIPLGRVGAPDDIARVVAFLASDESSYMTGQAINVTGGLWMN